MTSNSEFGASTTAGEAARALGEEIRGRVVLITGVGPNGLGSALALALSAHEPALLILASRTLSKVQAIARSLPPSVAVKCILLDLEELNSVRVAAGEIRDVLRAQEPGKRKIHVVVNNAGVNLSVPRVTKQAVDAQMGINYLGPWLLTALLVRDGSLLAAKDGAARVVNVTSEAHRMAGVKFSDLGGKEDEEDEEEMNDGMRRYLKEKGFLRDDGAYEPWIAYARSKTANILFSVALNTRGVRSLAVHPGNIWTELARDMDATAMRPFASAKPEDLKTLEQGAATMVVAGFDPNLAYDKGIYLEDCQFRWPKRWATDPLKAERLWRLSEDLVGDKFDFNFEAEKRDNAGGKQKVKSRL